MNRYPKWQGFPLTREPKEPTWVRLALDFTIFAASLVAIYFLLAAIGVPA